MAQYTVTHDFTGRSFKPDPDGSFTSKSFKKGDTIEAEAIIDSNGIEHLVTPDGFLVEGNVELVKIENVSNTTNGNNSSGTESFFTTKNIIIGIVVIVAIIAILKWRKVF